MLFFSRGQPGCPKRWLRRGNHTIMGLRMETDIRNGAFSPHHNAGSLPRETGFEKKETRGGISGWPREGHSEEGESGEGGYESYA